MWKNCYAEHEVTGKIYNFEKKKKKKCDMSNLRNVCVTLSASKDIRVEFSTKVTGYQLVPVTKCGIKLS